MDWKKYPIPLEYFTRDVVLLLSDIDLQTLADEFDLHCEVFVHPGKYFSGSSSGFAFQKDSPLKEVIDYQLLKFFQSGLLEQLVKKYLKTERRTCEPPVKELDFKATICSFAILGCGVMTALIVAFIEKTFKH